METISPSLRPEALRPTASWHTFIQPLPPLPFSRDRRIRAALQFVCAASLLLLLGGCAAIAPTSSVGRSATVSGYSGAASRGDAAAAPRAESRPGLGTGWGEERDSQVSRTSFVRANGDHPTAVDQIYYNDREGIEAMLAHEGGRSRDESGMARMAGGLVSVGVRDDSGRWLDGWQTDGRRFVAGNRGDRYEIVLRNDTRDRIEVVLSVDGLDVMDGRNASFRKRGYIVYAGDTLTVDGFRTSSSTVAAFRFSSVSRSYAALKHGDTRNVGVVGLAVFTEREPEGWRRRGANPFPGSRWATPPE